MNYRKLYHRGHFTLQRVIAIIFCSASLVNGVLAMIDLTLGLDWGYTWWVVPMTLAFCGVGYGWYRLFTRLDRDLDGWPDT